MNILENLKNIDFKTQFVKISFTDETQFETPFICSSEDEYLKHPPKFTDNGDGSCTIYSNDKICCFKTDCIIKIEIGKICFIDKVIK